MAQSSSTIVLITGANSGIGYAASQVLASTPSATDSTYHVIIASRSIPAGSTALTEIESSLKKDNKLIGSLSTIQLDVTEESSIAAAAKEVEKSHGRLDVLINNAGVAAPKDDDLQKSFSSTFQVNVIGTALTTRAFEPLLSKSKKPYVLYIGSTLGSLAFASDPPNPSYSGGWLAYKISKAALNMLVIEDAKRLGPEGVKVFVLCPGLVRSKLRGGAVEEVSAGGRAGDPLNSGRFFEKVIRGERDGDAGKFLFEGGVRPW